MKIYPLKSDEELQRLADARKKTRALFNPAPVNHTGMILRIRATLYGHFPDVDQESIEVKPIEDGEYDFVVTGFEYAGLIAIEDFPEEKVLTLHPDEMALGPVYLSLSEKHLCRFTVNFTDGPMLGNVLKWHWAFTQSEAKDWAGKFRRANEIKYKKTLIGVAPYHKRFAPQDPDTVSKGYCL